MFKGYIMEWHASLIFSTSLLFPVRNNLCLLILPVYLFFHQTRFSLIAGLVWSSFLDLASRSSIPIPFCHPESFLDQLTDHFMLL